MKVTLTHHSVLKSDDDKQYVVYNIHVNYEGVIWQVGKRYSEFEKLHSNLSKVINTKKFGKFPKKFIVGNLKEEKIQERRDCLQNYLDNLLSEPLVPNLQEVIEFFEVNQHWDEIKVYKEALVISFNTAAKMNQENQNVLLNNEETSNPSTEHTMTSIPERVSSPKYEQASEEIKHNTNIGQVEMDNQTQFIAIRDHVAKDETELSFKSGNIIEVIQKGATLENEEDCYWYGRVVNTNGFSSQGFFDARCLDLGIKQPKLSIFTGDIYDESSQIDGSISTIEIDYVAENPDEVSVQRGQQVRVLPSSRQNKKGFKLVETLSESNPPTVISTGYLPSEYLMII